MNLSVRRHEVDGVAVVRCDGELDGESAARLSSELELALDAIPPVVVVDLCGLTFIDSSGVHVVLRKRVADVAVETTVLVVAAAERIREVFELTALADGVPLHRSLGEALDSLAAHAGDAVDAPPIPASRR
jgi:anti-anti-sigma factor